MYLIDIQKTGDGLVELLFEDAENVPVLTARISEKDIHQIKQWAMDNISFAAERRNKHE